MPKISEKKLVGVQKKEMSNAKADKGDKADKAGKANKALTSAKRKKQEAILSPEEWTHKIITKHLKKRRKLAFLHLKQAMASSARPTLSLLEYSSAPNVNNSAGTTVSTVSTVSTAGTAGTACELCHRETKQQNVLAPRIHFRYKNMISLCETCL